MPPCIKFKLNLSHHIVVNKKSLDKSMTLKAWSVCIMEDSAIINPYENNKLISRRSDKTFWELWDQFVQFFQENLPHNNQNTYGGVLILEKLQAETCNFTKINPAPWVFFTFFKLYKWYQIAQRTTKKPLQMVSVTWHDNMKASYDDPNMRNAFWKNIF